LAQPPVLDRIPPKTIRDHPLKTNDTPGPVSPSTPPINEGDAQKFLEANQATTALDALEKVSPRIPTVRGTVFQASYRQPIELISPFHRKHRVTL
jgi:hypothetical protein